MDRTSPTSSRNESPVQARLTGRVRGGANWFFWIAGASIVNSIALGFGLDPFVAAGLGSSQIFHSVVRVAAIDHEPAVPWLLAFALVADLFVAGVLAVAGLFARRGVEAAFVLGMSFYALDGLLFLFSPERMPVLFHAAALLGIGIGYAALRRLRRLGDSRSEVASAAA